MPNSYSLLPANSPIMYSSIDWFSLNSSGIDKSSITEIEVMLEYEATGNELSYWDISLYEDESVIAYIDGEKLIISGYGGDSILLDAYSDRVFADFTNLTTITNANLFDTSYVTNLNSAFSQCHSLCNLNISSWDVSNVEDIGTMFLDCYAIKEMDFSGWNITPHNMVGMFNNCTSLVTIYGLDKFDTSLCTNMAAMFSRCQSLQSLDISSFNTGNVRFFSHMFSGCTNLSNITGIDSFETFNGVAFESMFEGCSKVKELNLSSFDTRNAKDGVIWYGTLSSKTTANMFDNMQALEKIIIGNNFSFTGDGTTTTNIAILPSPSSEHIAKADGNWHTETGDIYAPDAIPNLTAGIYYAWPQVAPDYEVRLKNSTLVSVSNSIRNLTGDTDVYYPREMATKINEATAETELQASLVEQILAELNNKIAGGAVVDTCTLTISTDGNGYINCCGVTKYSDGAFHADNRQISDGTEHVFSGAVCGSSVYIKDSGSDTIEYRLVGVEGARFENGFLGTITAPSGGNATIYVINPTSII